LRSRVMGTSYDPTTYRKAIPNQHLQRSHTPHAKRPPHGGFVQVG
jgi:hypothetical protein